MCDGTLLSDTQISLEQKRYSSMNRLKLDNYFEINRHHVTITKIPLSSSIVPNYFYTTFVSQDIIMIWCNWIVYLEIYMSHGIRCASQYRIKLARQFAASEIELRCFYSEPDLFIFLTKFCCCIFYCKKKKDIVFTANWVLNTSRILTWSILWMFGCERKRNKGWKQMKCKRILRTETWAEIREGFLTHMFQVTSKNKPASSSYSTRNTLNYVTVQLHARRIAFWFNDNRMYRMNEHLKTWVKL